MAKTALLYLSLYLIFASAYISARKGIVRRVRGYYVADLEVVCGNFADDKNF